MAVTVSNCYSSMIDEHKKLKISWKSFIFSKLVAAKSLTKMLFKI